MRDFRFLLPLSLLPFAGCGEAPVGGGLDLAGWVVDLAGAAVDGPEAADMATSADGAGRPTAADSGFRPKPNGFQFANYGVRQGITNLTPVEVRRFFGDSACAAVMNGQCVLTPAAEAWMDEKNRQMGGGHCDGFAALSLQLHRKIQSPGELGDGATNAFDLDLDDNVKVQREIAYWWTTQTTNPTLAARRPRLLVNDLLDRLIDSFRGADPESYTLSFWKSDWTGGHAVTPYAVVDKGNGKVWLMVYDNNFPDVERHFEFDRNTTEWSYTASINPNAPKALYAGDDMTKTLQLVPTGARRKPQICPFCGEVDANGPPMAGGVAEFRELSLIGDGSLLIADPQGRRLGWVGGKLISEIPGAYFNPIPSDDLWADDPEPTYLLPHDSRLTVTVDGAAMAGPSLSDVTLVAPGYTLGVEGILLDPGQKDTLTVAAKGNELTYRTDSADSPVLRLGVATKDADWDFAVALSGEAGGQTVTLRLDLAKGRLAIVVASRDGAGAWGVEVSRLHSDGESVFSHGGNQAAMSDTLYLEYGAWKGQGTPMPLGIDRGSDGTIDQTIQLTDDK